MSYFLNKMMERQDGVDDLCLISQNDDSNITKQLGTRLRKGKIYTGIGEVLVAVNPYQRLDIYGEVHIRKYQNASLGETSPHVYGLAERAYRQMRDLRQPQAVIISGESGAGKTESAKLLLQYISSVSGSSGVSMQMKEVILKCNPLLESLGNAKTVRNNNSSRFGKYLNLFFNDRAEPIGGTTSNFLLEKTRVVKQQKGERNFHIFYQLLASGWNELYEQCYLQGLSAMDFFYTNQSRTVTVDGMNDADMFRQVIDAMNTVRIDQTEQWYIFSTLAAILHLGNLELYGRDAPCDVQRGTEAYLQTAAYLLGVDPDALMHAITHKRIQMGGRRGSIVQVPQNGDQATQIKDALAKELYSRTFDHVIQRVNQVMYPQNYTAGQSIGILDIYGFEIFDNNSFEQFCINYVNERLQQIFIELTIKGEQREYKNEGLPWKDVPYFDNKVVCDLIEGSNPPGLMRLLDDTCRSMHAMDSQGVDDGFMDKIQGTRINAHPHLQVQGRSFFTVKHYAGDVKYRVDGFCFKNMDNLYQSLQDCMRTSSNEFVNYLWQQGDDGGNGRQPSTSGMKIRKSAKALVDSLMQCSPHYIRCIKPNETKSAMYMEDKRVIHQVKYLGLVQNVKVKKAGYSYRAPYAQFLQQFYMLDTQNQQNYINGMQGYGGNMKGMAKQLTDYLSRKHPGEVPSNEWAFGQTKIFVSKPSTIFFIEELREQAIDPEGYAEKVRQFEQAEKEAEKLEARMNVPDNKKNCCVLS